MESGEKMGLWDNARSSTDFLRWRRLSIKAIKRSVNKTHALKRPVPRNLSLSKGGARLRRNESGAGKLTRDVHPLVPEDALLKVGEAGVCHESEDLLVHGDDLSRGV